MKTLLLIFILTTWGIYANAQPSDIFQGGFYDGFGKATIASDQSFFLGSSYDGAGSASLETSITFYRGDTCDGFAFLTLNSSSLLYHGGIRDGHASAGLESTTTFYKGGTADGADTRIFEYYHLWTGDVGSGWLISGNWTNGIIPTVYARVRIPADRPHYPGLNGSTGNGIFAVGSDADSPAFACKSLVIDQGGEVTVRINARLRNYSSIDVAGDLFHLNPSSNSFINQPGSSLLVRMGGRVLGSEE